MPKIKKYIFNQTTLSYEEEVRSKKARTIKCAAVFVVSILITFLYFWIYVAVMGNELPKTAYLRKVNEEWNSKIDILDRQLYEYSEVLTSLQIRDDDVYRSLFGMNPIPKEVREAGFGGVNRYSYLDGIDNGQLRSTVMRLDILMKKSYIQSKSFDEVLALSKRAGDMASCIPKISPIIPDKSKYRLSSGFGVRIDPVYGGTAMHSGLDFSLPIGSPVYSTGDGVVYKVIYGRTGYGNNIIVDHGFGYMTRYAHMNSISVEEGMKVSRGDLLGETGNSGKSTGPHLHYEVIYMNRPVNPFNYLDLDISPEEYASMLRYAEGETDAAMSGHKE